MKQVSKYSAVIAIFAILAFAVISGIGEADAVKAKEKGKTTPKSIGHKNIHKVCGAKLCSSGENPDPKNIGRVK